MPNYPTQKIRLGWITNMIYKILKDSEFFMEFSTDLEKILDEIGQHVDELKIMHFSQHNLKLLPYWKKFEGAFKQVRTGATKTPDITCWRGATLVISETAYLKLTETLSPYGEFLPITCNNIPYYIFNCLELATLDANKSSPNTSNSGLVERIVFDTKSTEGKLVFKSKEQGCTAIFCDENFKHKILSENLTGIKFSTDLAEIF